MSTIAPPRPSTAVRTKALLDDHYVKEAMRSGVMTIGETATRDQAWDALTRTGADALLVLSPEGHPVGWLFDCDIEVFRLPLPPTLAGLIRERVTAIDPEAPLRSALYALSLAGVSRLLVRPRGDQAGVGVLTLGDF